MSKQETGVAKPKSVKPDRELATLKDDLNSEWFKKQVEKLGATQLTPERLARIATTALLRVNHLEECSKASVFECLFTLGQCGLEPDGRNAHLIPRWDRNANGKDKGAYVCTLQIDYKGLVELAMRTGLVSSIHAAVVYDEDVFEYDLGEIKSHKPNLKIRHGRDDWYAVYAVVKYKDGGMSCDVMRQYEVFDIRDRSQSWKAFESKAISTCPWHTDLIEMSKKTVFKRLTKWISISPQLDAAVDHDNDFEPLPQLPVRQSESPPLVIPDRLESPADDRRRITQEPERTQDDQGEEGEEPEGEHQEEAGETEPESTQEHREQEEIQARAAAAEADRPAWPQPVRNILMLVRKAETALTLQSFRNSWDKISADHPEAVETVEAAFTKQADKVAAEGQKKKP